MGLTGRFRASARRSGPESARSGGTSAPIVNRRTITTFVLSLVFAVTLVVLLGLGNPPLPFRRGQVAKADIPARVSFKVDDAEATRVAREKAAAAAPNVYRVDRSSFELAVTNLRKSLEAVLAAAEFAKIDPATAGALGLSEDFFKAVKTAGEGAVEEEIVGTVVPALNEIIRKGGISASDAKQEEGRSATADIIILDKNDRYVTRFSNLLREDEIRGALRDELREIHGNSPLTDALVDYLAPFLRPFLFYDQEESREARRAAEAEVAQIELSFYRGDVLVRRDSVIDRQHMRNLQKEQQVYLAEMPRRDRVLRVTGVAVTVLVLVTLFGAYVRRYERRVFERRARMVVLMILTVLLAATARFFVRSSLSWYLIPLPLLAMAVAVAYNQVFALGYTLFLAILIGISTGSDFALSVSLFLGAAVGVFALGRVASRPRPLVAGLAAGAGICLAAWGTGLLFHTDFRLTFKDSSFGFVNGGICGVLLTVLLPFIERGFNVLTDLSLLELADLNKPLLRRLALEAPGTYNHSLFVGSLADAASAVVGANRLFARVGGYYHDIGKLSKPDYFVENHGTAPSRHLSLSPTMSALVIISHVKDGVEMAREHNLPTSLVDLIREHHGTTLVEYFYREAMDKAPDSGHVSDQNFRYPGPKPRTKETAIIMLSDSVESASRTIADPTPARLEGLVADVTHRKLADGQFDECALTMADMRKIEISLTKSLAGMFHSRIKYPGREL